jgi:hypothetical protein
MTVWKARLLGMVASPALILSLLFVLGAVFDTDWEGIALPLWMLHFLFAIPVIPLAGHGWMTTTAECLFWSVVFAWRFGEFVKSRESARRGR